MESSSLGMRVTVIRTATHPFLARYNLLLRVERSDGCTASSDLFPDTGMVSRRNLYAAPSGAIGVIGQFDARVLSKDRCRIELVEFQNIEQEQIFLGTFDLDEQGRWRFMSPLDRQERSFEKS